jgi:CubicO group peptidase (beta-lactamase class C family)
MRHLIRFTALILMTLLLAVTLTQADTPATFPTRGWTLVDPYSQGMDGSLLEASNQTIRSTYPHIHSLLVVRHGELVWEKYYRRYNRNTRHPVMSVTKSVVSALTGIAIDRGFIPGQEAQVSAYYPEYFPDGVDGRKLGLQVRHLLQLRSGLDWAEYSPVSRESGQVLSSVGYALNLPMYASPGDAWRYSTGDYHVMSGVITRAMGMSTLQFADATLFSFLGITSRRWQTDAEGVNIGGIGLALTPRDMAKFGYLYLNNGIWDGQQIVSPGWVQLTTSPQPGNPMQPNMPGYGYGWWIFEMHGQRVYYAAGFGGQFIFVIPAFDMVVVMTGDENVSPPVHDANSYQSMQIVNNYVLFAIQN